MDIKKLMLSVKFRTMFWERFPSGKLHQIDEVPLRNAVEMYKETTNPTNVEILFHYFVEGKSYRATGNQFNVSYEKVRSVVQEGFERIVYYYTNVAKGLKKVNLTDEEIVRELLTTKGFMQHFECVSGIPNHVLYDAFFTALEATDAHTTGKYRTIDILLLRYKERISYYTIAKIFDLSKSRPEQIVWCFIRRMKAKLYAYSRLQECKDDIQSKMNERIDILCFSARTYNCLRRNSVDTIRELCGVTADEVRLFRNCGKSTYQEILDKLNEHGLSLKA